MENKMSKDGYRYTELDYPYGVKKFCRYISIKEYKEMGGNLYRCNLNDFIIDKVTPKHTLNRQKKGGMPESVVSIPAHSKKVVFVIANDMDEAENKFNSVLEYQQFLLDKKREEANSAN